MGNAPFLSLTLSAAVSCSVLAVVWIAHFTPSARRPRSALQISAFASLVVVPGGGCYLFVTTAMPFLAHVVVGVALAGYAWALFAASAARMPNPGGESAQQAAERLAERGDVAGRPGKFLATFYAVFGRRALTVRFFAACLGTSLLAGHIAGVAMDAPGEYGDIVLATTLISLLPATVLLLKTRAIIKRMPRRPSTGHSLLFAAFDVLLTLMILLTVTWAVFRLFSSRTPGLLEHSVLLLREVFYPLPYDDTSGGEWVLFLVAGLTSMWVWLYTASHVLSRVVGGFPRLRERMGTLTPDLSVPLHRLGALAVAIVLVSFFGVAPLVRVSVRLSARMGG